MKKKQTLAFLLALVMMFSVFAGCAGNNDTTTEEQTTAAQETTAETAGEITITDQIGREVTLEAPAEKIVSAYYLSSSLLIALGAEDKVVGIEMKADTRGLYKLAAPQFLDLPAVGSGKGINVEETAALEPDLVIIPKKLSDSVEQFEALNIPVVVIDPETLDSFLETVDILGKLTGCEEKAQSLIDDYNQVITEVSELTKDVENKPLVYIAGSDMLRTAGTGMYQNDLIEIAGGTNAAASIEDSAWVDITAEELLSWNPEKVYVVSYSDYTMDEFIAAYPQLTATQSPEENVKVFPGAIEPWDYPTASAPLGVLWLANDLHPELVSDEDLETRVTEFYKEYFDIDVTLEDVYNYETAAA